MLKILKMDLYRMIKNKSTWILLAITTFLIVFPVVISKVAMKPAQIEMLGVMHFSSYVTGFIIGGNPLLLIAIFIALFYGSIYKTGFIKNVANFAHKKYDFVLSTVVISMIYILIIFATISIASYLSMWIAFGEVVIDNVGLFFKVLSVQFVLYVALSVLAILICTFMRKSGGAMAVCVLYFSGFGISLWQLVASAISYLLKTDFNLCDYLVSVNLMSYNMEKAASDQWWHAPVIGLCYFVVFLVASAFAMNRREID